MATEKDLERSVVITDTPRNGDVSSIAIETGGLRRELGSRHINMIAIAGMIVRPSQGTMLC
jgi:amino acid transporter